MIKKDWFFTMMNEINTKKIIFHINHILTIRSNTSAQVQISEQSNELEWDQK